MNLSRMTAAAAVAVVALGATATGYIAAAARPDSTALTLGGVLGQPDPTRTGIETVERIRETLPGALFGANGVTDVNMTTGRVAVSLAHHDLPGTDPQVTARGGILSPTHNPDPGLGLGLGSGKVGLPADAEPPSILPAGTLPQDEEELIDEGHLIIDLDGNPGLDPGLSDDWGKPPLDDDQLLPDEGDKPPFDLPPVQGENPPADAPPMGEDTPPVDATKPPLDDALLPGDDTTPPGGDSTLPDGDGKPPLGDIPGDVPGKPVDGVPVDGDPGDGDLIPIEDLFPGGDRGLSPDKVIWPEVLEAFQVCLLDHTDSCGLYAAVQHGATPATGMLLNDGLPQGDPATLTITDEEFEWDLGPLAFQFYSYLEGTWTDVVLDVHAHRGTDTDGVVVQFSHTS